MARFNVDFSEEAIATLDELARRNRTTKAEILRRAINLEKWFTDTVTSGAKVIVQTQDGTQREVLKL
jgi:predicted transcriptional regulator